MEGWKGGIIMYRLPKLFKRGDRYYEFIYRRKFYQWDNEKLIKKMKKKFGADVVLKKKNYIYFLRRVENAIFTELNKKLEEKNNE
jgi:hypothetical protein